LNEFEYLPHGAQKHVQENFIPKLIQKYVKKQKYLFSPKCFFKNMDIVDCIILTSEYLNYKKISIIIYPKTIKNQTELYHMK
jgi:hypothetical protein